MSTQLENSWITRKTSLTENVISFSRFLRNKGFGIGPTEESEALKALSILNTYDQEYFKDVLQSIYVKNRKQHLNFERYFLEYWKEYEKAADSKTKDSKEALKSETRKPPSLKSLKDWLYGNNSETEEESLSTYSSLDVLTEKDFSLFSSADIDEIKQILWRIQRNLTHKKRRRFSTTKKPSNVDLRKSIRKNIRTGTDLINLQYKTRDKEKNQIILLCDVSKSMELYSSFLIQFMYAFQSLYRSIETFAFSYKLERITSILKDQEFDEAMSSMSDSIHHWSSGTRIGKSFEEFVNKYPTLINNHSILIIMSDGWDTGDLELLENTVKWMSRKSKKIIWLNPLLAQADYRPETGGMKAVLPYIKELKPCHNIQSLRELIRTLR